MVRVDTTVSGDRCCCCCCCLKCETAAEEEREVKIWEKEFALEVVGIAWVTEMGRCWEKKADTIMSSVEYIS